VTFESHFGDLLTVVTLSAELTRDLLAIAELLVMTHSDASRRCGVCQHVTWLYSPYDVITTSGRRLQQQRSTDGRRRAGDAGGLDVPGRHEGGVDGHLPGPRDPRGDPRRAEGADGEDASGRRAVRADGGVEARGDGHR